MSTQSKKLPDQYAVIGNPIAHSQSPFIHRQFALQTGESLTYEAILSPVNEFEMTVKKFQLAGGKGVNITLPFKSEAFKLADHHSQAADIARTANTLVFNKDNTIFADNTDGVGLLNDLTKNLHMTLTNKKILILGAGGATCGILPPLLQSKPSHILIANRTLEKATHLINQFIGWGPLNACRLDHIPRDPYDLIINATSISIQSEKFNFNLFENLISPKTICYDLAYGKLPTHFLDWAKTSGAAHCFDGLGMLVEQAAAAFNLWRGIYPDTKPVIAALIQHLRG